MELAATAIFVVAYVLLSLRRLAHIPIERPPVALVAASLMVLVGALSPEEAIDAIDLDTLLLLVGMMLLVVTLEATGLFHFLAERLVARARTQAQLLVRLCIATAVLSALILNDAVVLFFTPVIIHAARLLNINPVKFLVAEALSANVGSVATQIGNPQNAYIAQASGIPFVRHLAVMGPIMALCLAFTVAVLLVLYRHELRKPLPERPSTAPDPGAAIRQPRLLAFALLAALGVFAGFLTSHLTGLPLSVIALAGGSILVFGAPLLGRASPRVLFRRVDWSIILLFIGLFVMLRAITNTGLFSQALHMTQPLLSTVWGLGAVVGVASNLVSNVPAAVLFSHVVTAHANEALWLTLSAATTLAGNATILGAAANIIVAEQSEALGVRITFWDFAKAGLPIAIGSLALAFATIHLFT